MIRDVNSLRPWNIIDLTYGLRQVQFDYKAC